MSQDLDREILLDAFALEATEHIAAIEDALARLDHCDDHRAEVQAIFRSAHTIKGAAACIALDDVTQFMHGLENLVEQASLGRIAPDAAFNASVSEALDELRRLVEVTRRRRNESASARPGSRRTLRVDVEKLDRMLNTVGELGIARAHLGDLIFRGAGRADLLESERLVERLWSDLQDQVLQARMLPLSTAFKPLTRIVRDVAASCGKEATLAIEGGDVEIDLAVLEQLRDPLVHMIRNAVAHGIEAPEVRSASGKPRDGRIRLAARYDGGAVLVALSDDGAGLARETIRARAREAGLRDDDPARLIFEPGLTTATELDDVSGRGMGMDVVRRTIDSVRGSIDVTSHEGAGTTFTMRLPLTLAVIDGFAVVAGDATFVIPIDRVVECVACQGVAFQDDTAVMTVRGEPLPLVRLRTMFPDAGQTTPKREQVVVVHHGARRAGLVVDHIRGELQTVVRAVPSFFARHPAVTGSAILGDGRIALILDVFALLASYASKES